MKPIKVKRITGKDAEYASKRRLELSFVPAVENLFTLHVPSVKPAREYVNGLR